MDRYAFLMVDFEIPQFIYDLQSKIPYDELYHSDDPDDEFDYGLETETHITLVPCLDNDVNLSELQTFLKPLDSYSIMLENVSCFNNDKFDVLKCDVRGTEALYNTNHDIVKKFSTHSEYKKYNPHVTIAYLKKGEADKYTRHLITEPVFLKPTNFAFGYFDNDKYKRITFK